MKEQPEGRDPVVVLIVVDRVFVENVVIRVLKEEVVLDREVEDVLETAVDQTLLEEEALVDDVLLEEALREVDTLLLEVEESNDELDDGSGIALVNSNSGDCETKHGQIYPGERKSYTTKLSPTIQYLLLNVPVVLLCQLVEDAVAEFVEDGRME
jgi:hypothetical protein